MTRPALPGFTVPNLGRSATTLVTAPSTMRRAVYFADDGGVQFVDALGNVVTVASGTGASLSANNTFTGRNGFVDDSARGRQPETAGANRKRG